jgi:hypothetical protein
VATFAIDVRDIDVRDTDVRDIDVRDIDVRDTDVRDTNVGDAEVRDAGVPAPIPQVVRRRPPATVISAAALGLLESIALLAGALTGLDGLLTSPDRPGAVVVLLVLVSIATWIVLCAGGAATLVDGAGRGLVTWVACAEVALTGVLFFVALFTPRDEVPISPDLPLPAVALLVLAVPVGKLLLAGAPTAVEWVAAGPRPRERRTDPTKTHKDLCVVTLAVIGIVLGTVTLIGAPATDDPGSTAASTH